MHTQNTYNRKIERLVVQDVVFYLGNLSSNLDYIMVLLFVI